MSRTNGPVRAESHILKEEQKMGAQIAEIAERIKDLREILGLSYADMAGELGISDE